MKKFLSMLLLICLLLTSVTSLGLALAETEGVSLTVGCMMPPQNISPFTIFTNRGQMYYYLYETLALKAADGTFYGILAKDWTTEDNLHYSFEIYDYIYDTAGNHITASDCVYSIEHCRDEGAVTYVVSVNQTGEYTFDLELMDDTSGTLQLAMERCCIVSQAAYEASSDKMAVSSISTAPYMVTDYVPNVSIAFEKNPNYWQTDESVQNPLYRNMTVDKLEYIKIAESSQQTIALETGAIDAFEKIGNTEVANFIEGGRDADNFTVLGYPSDLSYIFYFSREGICGNDVNLRKAMLYGIDKEALLVGGFDGMGTLPTFYGAPGGMSDLTPNSASEDYFKYDLERNI